MPLFYKFKQNDIFYNRIKAHPRSEFFLYESEIYYNNNPYLSSSISVYELNNDNRPTQQLIYPYIYNNRTMGLHTSLLGGQYIRSPQDRKREHDLKYQSYGEKVKGVYPLTASISKNYWDTDTEVQHNESPERPEINSLINMLNYYGALSPHYLVNRDDDVTRSYLSASLGLVSIPSIYYGSSIKKGSVSLKYYVSGSLISEVQDKNQNGELIEITSSMDGVATGSVVGVVMYNEGFILLTGSTALDTTHQENYTGDGNDNPKWIYWGNTISSSVSTPSSSYVMSFEGTEYIPTLTMMAHADRGHLNYSNNPTFLKSGQDLAHFSGSVSYKEPDLDMANIVKTGYEDPTGSFENITYISKVGIYDADNNLIAVAKLANPVRKREQDSYTFKLKLDM
tara:strand:- start:312 stop:1499 length:1188 start_codon:yes stop_codon:yes gene_type:complete